MANHHSTVHKLYTQGCIVFLFCRRAHRPGRQQTAQDGGHEQADELADAARHPRRRRPHLVCAPHGAVILHRQDDPLRRALLHRLQAIRCGRWLTPILESQSETIAPQSRNFVKRVFAFLVDGRTPARGGFERMGRRRSNYWCLSFLKDLTLRVS